MSFPFAKDLTASITGDAPSGNPQPSSTGGLFSSAKIVSDAAQSAYKRESFDQAKAAGAAEDILGAASTYGKLDERGYGKYVDQAEDYLQKFRGPVDVKPAEEVKTEEPVEEKPAPEVKLSEEPVEDQKPAAPEEGKSEKPAVEEGKSGGGGGGYGDLVKLAGGFVEKYQGGEEGKTKESGKKEEESSGGGGGGFGNYFKKAEGFLK